MGQAALKVPPATTRSLFTAGWLKRRRQTGGIDAVPIFGRPRVKGGALEGWLPEHLEANLDLTLEEHRETFEGTKVSTSTVVRAIRRLS
jgi:hypothetical protein